MRTVAQLRWAPADLPLRPRIPDLSQPSLVVLAAGLGSRFGGPKQLVPVGPAGETLADYAVHDARRAGIGRVVFVVRPEHREVVEVSAARRVRDLEVRVAVQPLPEGGTRRKPWGTGHAVLAAAPHLPGPFLVANADDFYGASAYAAVADALRAGGADAWVLAGYRVRDTVPESGGVSRAACTVDDRGRLMALSELRDVRRAGDDRFTATGPGGVRTLRGDDLVSMNLWGFTPAVLERLRSGFERFVGSAPADDAEYLLPDAVADALAAGAARVRVVPVPGPWAGLTHPEDLPVVRRFLAARVAAGAYPSPLAP